MTVGLLSPGTDRRRRPRTRWFPGVATPRLLRVIQVVPALLVLLFGAVAAVGVQDRADAVSRILQRSEPLSVGAQEIYRSLSDADATSSSAFLAGGAITDDARTRFDNDIAQAATVVSAATGVDSAGTDQADLQVLATQLPVYAGLVQAGRADNRAQIQVGAAYQQEASALMRSRLLPAAQSLYRAETARLGADHTTAASFPFYGIAAGVVALAGLGVAQVALRQRTNRLINRGLAGATVAVLLGCVWMSTATLMARGGLQDAATHGSAPVEALSQARFAALQARTDESLMLIARDGEDSYSQDFDAVMSSLTKPDGGLLVVARAEVSDPRAVAALEQASLAAKSWQTTDMTLRSYADGNTAGRGYDDAVQLAIGPAPNTATEAAAIDQALATAIQIQHATFSRSAGGASDDLWGLVPGTAVLAVLGAGAVAVGLYPRLREYYR